MNEDEKKEVLVIDDEKLAELIANMLETEGLKSRTVNNGKDAIAIFREEKEKVALIIMDMEKYKNSEEDIFLSFQKINPNVKVMLISASCKSKEVNLLLDKGCVGFIGKPFGLEGLLGEIRKVL